MPLAESPAQRTLLHTRSIDVQAYERDDGLWDIEAHLTDIKTHDVPLRSGVRRAGDAMHDLWLRVTVDERFNVVDAQASSDEHPYPPHCAGITPAYRKLIGLNLLKRFRYAVKERLGNTDGCTHLSELASVMPTAAVQGLAARIFKDEDGPDGRPPFQLDKCHAMAAEGEGVRQYYPRWYRSKPGGSKPGAPSAPSAE